ncbi:MAG: hypothetical protein H0W61_01320 [Bacteroidetes bacterium]|nr:hypothetical protein [Bacteroidota bacterium]
MPILIFVFILTCRLSMAQNLNDIGLYVNSEGDLFNGVLTVQKDKVKSELSVRNGVIEGPANYFYASGNLMESGNFTGGKKDQKWIRYNENGVITATAFYSLGKKAGIWQVFDDNGKIRFEMKYQDGEKTGIWTSWDESGIVSNTKNYSVSN